MTPNDRSMKQSETGGGVSPVIGIILMVVITVVLAAVIGAFILGLGDEIDSPQDQCVESGGDVLSKYTMFGGPKYCLYEDNDTLVDMDTGEVVIRGGVG